MSLKNTLLFLIVTWFLYHQTAFCQQHLVFDHGGLERSYILYLPASLPEHAPLLLVMHGYTSSANNIMDYSGFNQLADEQKFAVCYPQGIKDSDNNTFWNVGYDFHHDQTVDDVGFLSDLAIYLQNGFNLSSDFTFTTGMSNGGDVSYLLACQAPHIFKAAAPVAGCMMQWIQDSCSGSNPIPVFEIHGSNDNTTLWEGDINNNDGWGPYYSIPATFEFWINKNNCSDSTQTQLEDTNSQDGSHVISHRFTNGINGNLVWLYEVVNGGHDWPGAWGNMDINSAEEIWKFFQIYMAQNPSGTEQDQIIIHEGIYIYPNPTRNFLIIELKNIQNIEYQIFNISGKSLKYGMVDKQKNYMPFGDLCKGVYYLKIGGKSFKLIKI